MSEFNFKKIEISGYNVGLSINVEPNTTKLANDLIEKYCKGRLIEITEAHAQMLIDLSSPDKLDKPPAEILEDILKSIKIVVEKNEEKTEITLAKGKKKKLKVKHDKENFVTKYKI